MLQVGLLMSNMLYKGMSDLWALTIYFGLFEILLWGMQKDLEDSFPVFCPFVMRMAYMGSKANL